MALCSMLIPKLKVTNMQTLVCYLTTWRDLATRTIDKIRISTSNSMFPIIEELKKGLGPILGQDPQMEMEMISALFSDRTIRNLN